MNLLIRGATFFDRHKTIANGECLVSGNKIQWLGSRGHLPESLRPKNLQLLELDHDWLVTPAFINSHTHVAMSFLRDLAFAKENMIEDFFFKQESALTPQRVAESAVASVAAGVYSGVGTFIDHYYMSSAITPVFKKFGVRSMQAETLADLGGAFPEQRTLSQLGLNSCDDDLQSFCLGPHAMDTISDNYLAQISQWHLQTNKPVHMHLAQTRRELEYCLQHFSMTPVARAQQKGLLSQKTLAVHLLAVTADDEQILAATKPFVGLCPSSQILYEHCTDLSRLRRLGLKGCLGTDCAASHDAMDILQELRTLVLASRLQGCPFTIDEALATVWDNPAEFLQQPLGQITPGFLADLTFFKEDESTLPRNECGVHLVMTLQSRQVKGVIVNGQWVKAPAFSSELNFPSTR